MLNLAVVGVGGIGKTHLLNLNQMENVHIAALCDPSPIAKELAAEYDAMWFSDLSALLCSSNQVDAIIICTPTFLHTQQVKQVLTAGKHCFCEKPLCLSSLDARELYELAKQHNRILFVGHVLRFYQAYELAAAAIENQTYGRFLDAYLYRFTAKPTWLCNNWLFLRDKSGLIPYDLHIHDLDFLTSLLGSPRIEAVQAGGTPDSLPAEDHYRVLYRFGDVTACMEATWYEVSIPFQQGYRFYFDRALMVCDGDTCMLYEKDHEPRCLLDKPPMDSTATCINVTPTNAYFREMEHFIDCIRHNIQNTRVREDQVISVLQTLEALTGDREALVEQIL